MHISGLRWLLAAAVLCVADQAYAQGPVQNYEVPPMEPNVAETYLPIPYPLGHPRLETGGFFCSFEFAMFRQDNPLREQRVAAYGFFDTRGAITGVPGTFVGNNNTALDVQQVSGPTTYQPGSQVTLGWRFENGVTLEVGWLHLADAKYGAAASFIPFNNQVGAILENTFLTSPVFNFPPEFLGPSIKFTTPTNPPIPVPGGAPGIWNASTFQQLTFTQRFDQVDGTVRVPVVETDCWRSYGLIGPRAVVMWEGFKWRTVDFNLAGFATPTDAADYTNITSNRLYGFHLGCGNEWYLGTTPIGAFGVSVDAEVAIMMDIVKERASYELEDRSISANRSRTEYTIAPELQANIGLWWYPIEAIQIRVGYDIMTFFNTISSRNPIDFNYGAIAPEWNHIPTRFFDGFRAGIAFIF
jgi:hypothetical protein